MPVEVSYIRPSPTGGYDQSAPVASSIVTATGTHQVVGSGATAGLGVVVNAVGQDVKISIGTDPNAGTDTKPRLIGAGQIRFFANLSVGDKVSVVTI